VVPLAAVIGFRMRTNQHIMRNKPPLIVTNKQRHCHLNDGPCLPQPSPQVKAAGGTGRLSASGASFPHKNVLAVSIDISEFTSRRTHRRQWDAIGI
jgi:hypothetical protein